MTTSASRRSLVTCSAAAERFALDVAQVERVLRYTAPRTLPNSAPWLRGVVTVGEQLVPVLDLRERLGLPAAPLGEDGRILVLALQRGRVGFIVDAVHEVLAVEPAAVQDAPEVYRGLAKEFVRGLVRRGADVYVLLDADHLVSSQERLAMTAAVEELFYGR
jgi:chemotaxis signal transduction protein